MQRRALAVAMVVQVMAAGAAPADEVESAGPGRAPLVLPVGARVRLEVGGMHVEGRVSGTDALGLTVLQENGVPYNVALDSLDGVEVARRRPRLNAGFRAALIGAAIGGGVEASFLAGQQTAPDGSCTDAMGTPQPCATKAQVAESAAMGAVTGLVVGLLWPGHHWERVRVDRVRVGVGPAPGGGVMARASVSF